MNSNPMKTTLQDSRENEKENEEKNLAVWDLGSPLYDSYEVVTLSHLIERHLMILPSFGSSRISNNKISPDDHVAVSTTLVVSSGAGNGGRDDRRSLVKSLSGYVRAKLRRNRRNAGDEKPEKVKRKLRRGFSDRFGFSQSRRNIFTEREELK
ncbi:uncharacterized protein LOC126688161 [Mercurialis annua]|uniref:uncharacterized protein LOC126688161 n=1 Tax=Mercurialis annua TaxID=3986 RepID=UPI00215DF53C|nr:uncharacterized protein LOC126688161 [Mercurialis annua]